MKRLLLIGCLFAAFACTKEPAELSGGSGPNPPRIVGTPTSELALKGEISIKLTPEMAQAVAVAQAQLPATRSGAVTRSGVGTIDELLRSAPGVSSASSPTIPIGRRFTTKPA